MNISGCLEIKTFVKIFATVAMSRAIIAGITNAAPKPPVKIIEAAITAIVAAIMARSIAWWGFLTIQSKDYMFWVLGVAS